jgi:hypothetical protein
LFKTKIKDALEAAISGILKDVVVKSLEPALNAMTITKLIAPDTELMCGFSAAPDFSTKYLSIPMQMYARVGGHDAPVKAPTLPVVDAATVGNDVQLLLSTYSVESYFWAMKDEMAITYNHTMFPANSSFQLWTADPIMHLFAPGLEAAFPNEWMQMRVGLTGDLALTPYGHSFEATVPMGIVFDAMTSAGAKEAFTVECPVATLISIKVTDKANTTPVQEVIYAEVVEFVCDLKVINSHVGNVSVGLLQVAINALIPTLILKDLNKILAEGIPIPAVGPLTVYNGSVEYGTDYFAINANLNLAPSEETVHVTLPSGAASDVAAAAAEHGIPSTSYSIEGGAEDAKAVVYHGMQVHVSPPTELLGLGEEEGERDAPSLRGRQAA